MKNFGLLKEAYMEIMLEGLKTGDSDKKNTFKDFIKSLKKNPALKKQAKVYSLLEGISKIDEEMKEEFITEAISMISESDKQEMMRENIILAQTLFEYDFDISKLKYEKRDIHESISNLIFLKPNLSNVRAITESKNYLINKAPLFESNKKKEEDFLPTKTILKTAINKIDKTYPSLSENEIKIVASVLNGNVAEQEQIFNELKEECKNNLSEKASAGLEKGLIESALEKLEGMNFSNKTYQTDIVKLMSLNNSF